MSSVRFVSLELTGQRAVSIRILGLVYLDVLLIENGLRPESILDQRAHSSRSNNSPIGIWTGNSHIALECFDSQSSTVSVVAVRNIGVIAWVDSSEKLLKVPDSVPSITFLAVRTTRPSVCILLGATLERC